MDQNGEEEKSISQPEDDMDDIMNFLTKTFDDETNTGRHRQCLSCNLCAKTFNKISNAVDHVRTHLSQKPYACKHCGKSYTQSSNRDRHERNSVCTRRTQRKTLKIKAKMKANISVSGQKKFSTNQNDLFLG